jgi:hypothetical protein
MAQKLAEKATEVVIEAVRGERSAVIYESVDILYNLVVLWSEFGITGSEIWAEMDRRQALVGIAEKLPKEVGVGSTSSAEHSTGAVECGEMGHTSEYASSGSDDCQPFRAGNFRLRRGASRQRADHQWSPCRIILPAFGKGASDARFQNCSLLRAALALV